MVLFNLVVVLAECPISAIGEVGIKGQASLAYRVFYLTALQQLSILRSCLVYLVKARYREVVDAVCLNKLYRQALPVRPLLLGLLRHRQQLARPQILYPHHSLARFPS